MYFGSVRFFKHLILLTLLLLILVPSSLCIVFSVQKNNLVSEVSSLSKQISDQADSAARVLAILPDASLPATATASLSPDIDVPSYQALYPDLYCEPNEEELLAVDNTAHLTFDDGPSLITETVLKVLAEKNVKGTFFIVGRQLDKPENQERLKLAASEGHTIGIHTESHDYARIYASVEAFLEDFYKVWSRIKEITGVAPEIFRFPGGSINGYNYGIYQEIIAEMVRRGFTYYDWNVSAQDASANNLTPEVLTENATNTRGLKRIIVLMHDSDSRANTAAALPGIIDSLIAKGYTIQPLNNTIRPIVFGYKDK